MDQPPIGQRYTHVYHVRGTPESDSKKFRFRLASLAQTTFPESSYIPRTRTHTPDYKAQAIRAIQQEIGIPFHTSGQLSWHGFFTKVSVGELLDSITILSVLRTSEQESFINSVSRYLSEENLSYRIDANGGMHPLIDAAFTGGQVNAIAALGGARHSATAQSVNAIDACLLQSPVDYRGAIRLAFGACENLFKLMYGVPRLDAKTAGERIGKDQQAIYDGRTALTRASAKTLESFKDWVDAAHFYRHEEGEEEPSQPTEEFAILLISQGLSFVRWLASIDRIKQDS